MFAETWSTFFQSLSENHFEWKIEVIYTVLKNCTIFSHNHRFFSPIELKRWEIELLKWTLSLITDFLTKLLNEKMWKEFFRSVQFGDEAHTCSQGEPPMAHKLNRLFLLKHHFILFSYSLNYNQTEMRTKPFQQSLRNMKVYCKRKALPSVDTFTIQD